MILAQRLGPERLGTRQVLRKMGQLPILSVLVLSIVAVSGILAPWIAPHEPRIGNILERREPPVWFDEGTTKYLLGTDTQGRDVLTRILYGARISLILAAVVLGIGGGFGTMLGLVAGWYSGWLDELVMRLVDLVLAVPTILIAIALVAIYKASFPMLIGVMAFSVWPRFARMIRGEVLSIKTMDYVALAEVSGATTLRILTKHLLPGVTNTVIVLATLQVGQVILLEASLSFLGAGVPPPAPAWGSMVADGRLILVGAWWVATMPGIAITLTVMSLNLFGDWLRDRLDPMLRQVE